MYIAHFEYKEKEPEKMYFTAKNTDTAVMTFSAKQKEPIKFIINKDMTLTVQD